MSSIWLSPANKILINSDTEVILCEVCPCDASVTFLCLCVDMPQRLCLLSGAGYLTLFYNNFTGKYIGDDILCFPWFGRLTAVLECVSTELGLIPRLTFNVEGVGSVLNFPVGCSSFGSNESFIIPNIPSPCNPNLDVDFTSSNTLIGSMNLYDTRPSECPSNNLVGTCIPWPNVPLTIVCCTPEPFYYETDEGFAAIVLNGQIVLYQRMGFCRYSNFSIVIEGADWLLEVPLPFEDTTLGTAFFLWNGNEDIYNGLELVYQSSTIPIYRFDGEDYIEIESGDFTIIAIGNCTTDLQCEDPRYPETLIATTLSNCHLFDELEIELFNGITGTGSIYDKFTYGSISIALTDKTTIEIAIISDGDTIILRVTIGSIGRTSITDLECGVAPKIWEVEIEDFTCSPFSISFPVIESGLGGTLGPDIGVGNPIDGNCIPETIDECPTDPGTNYTLTVTITVP